MENPMLVLFLRDAGNISYRRAASYTLVHGHVYRYGMRCNDALAGNGMPAMQQVLTCARECVALGSARVAWRYYGDATRYRASRLLASQGKHWLASLLVSLPLHSSFVNSIEAR